jgi:hypothetical protein
MKLKECAREDGKAPASACSTLVHSLSHRIVIPSDRTFFGPIKQYDALDLCPQKAHLSNAR